MSTFGDGIGRYLGAEFPRLKAPLFRVPSRRRGRHRMAPCWRCAKCGRQAVAFVSPRLKGAIAMPTCEQHVTYWVGYYLAEHGTVIVERAS